MSRAMARRLRETVGPISTKVKAGARLWASRFRSVRASHVFDAVTAAASLADMITDILVLIQFHRDGLTGFFAASLCTLGLAQLSFAFLFTMEHTKRSGEWDLKESLHRLLVFICVLPFGQLVPVLAYLTSTFEVPMLRRMMKRCGLEAGRTPDVGLTTRLEEVEAKVKAHRGFFLEAFAEAIPQCAVQVVAGLSGHMNALGVVSVLLSIGVIASKSWVVAYSPHAPTMAFNALCIVADVLAFFGSLSWLFADLPPVADLHESLRGWFLILLALGAGTGALAAALGCSFIALDETLHRRRRKKANEEVHPGLMPIIYALCMVPVTVVYLMCRWTLLPLTLGSLGVAEPEREKDHRDFVQRLLAYVEGQPLARCLVAAEWHSGAARPSSSGSSTNAESTEVDTRHGQAIVVPRRRGVLDRFRKRIGGGDRSKAEAAAARKLRLHVTTAFLRQAVKEFRELTDVPEKPGMREKDRSAEEARRRRFVMTSSERFMRCVGHGGPSCAAPAAADETVAAPSRDIIVQVAPAAPAAAEPAPRPARKTNKYESITCQWLWLLTLRSGCRCGGRRPANEAATRTDAADALRTSDAALMHSGVVDAFLQAAAAAMLLPVPLMLVIWLLFTLLAFLVSIFYPLLQPLISVCAGGGAPMPMLARVLSASYVAILAALVPLRLSRRVSLHERLALSELSHAFPQAFQERTVQAVLKRIDASHVAAKAAGVDAPGGGGDLSEKLRLDEGCAGFLKSPMLTGKPPACAHGVRFHDDCSLCLRKFEFRSGVRYFLDVAFLGTHPNIPHLPEAIRRIVHNFAVPDDDDTATVVLPCGHRFHVCCLNRERKRPYNGRGSGAPLRAQQCLDCKFASLGSPSG